MKAKKFTKMYGLTVLIIVGLILTGCTSNTPQQTNSNDSKTEEQEMSNIDKVSLDLKALQDENVQLKERLVLLENSASDYAIENYINWSAEYPHLVKFIDPVPQEWDSIELSSDYGEIVITDPQLIQYANSLFILELTDESYPGGHYPYNIEPFNILLTNSSGSYQLQTSAQNYVTFAEDNYSYYIFEVSSEVANLGRALLPRPSYLPEESLESRLMNSGGVIYSYDETSYYYDFYQSKQRSITKMFLESEKRLITEDEVESTNFVVDIIYLLHGEQVLMRVFEDYVLISDNDGEMFWYKTDAELATSISATISAG